MLISRDFAFSHQIRHQIKSENKTNVMLFDFQHHLGQKRGKLYGNTYIKLIENNDYIIIKRDFSTFMQFIFTEHYCLLPFFHNRTHLNNVYLCLLELYGTIIKSSFEARLIFINFFFSFYLLVLLPTTILHLRSRQRQQYD